MEQRERAKLHCHTEHSIRDSTEKISVLVRRAKEMGVPALALTNHGIMKGMIEFVKQCTDNGIKPIPGVEGYYSDDNDIVSDTHIELYPENYEAYSYIGMALTEAGTRLHNGKPVFDTEMLKKYFGKDSPVHGKVMMASACVGGVFAAQMFANGKLSKEVSSYDEKIKKAAVKFDKEKYYELSEKITDLDEQILKIKERKAELKSVVDKKYLKEKKKIEKFPEHSEEYEKAVKEYQTLINEQDNAKREYISIDESLLKLSSMKKELSSEYKKLATVYEKIKKYKDEKSHISSKNMTEDQMYELMKEKAELMIDIFGKENVYCEIQYHGLDIEKYAFEYVIKLAEEYGLKLCTANDAHFAYNDPDSVRARQVVLSLKYEKYEETKPDHKEYYLKSDAELYEALSKVFSDDIIKKAFDGVDEIASRCNFEGYPKEKHYPKFIGDADAKLKELAYAGISSRYPDTWNKEKEDKLNNELKVISELGVSDYFCIVEDFIKACKEKDKYSIGPGRGSVVGSVVAYLTGITNIDPFKYDLLFERFLNSERITMPDIDTDFSNGIRDYAIKYVEKKYEKESICSIMTEETYGAKASIRSAAKFLGLEQECDGKYINVADKLAKKVPKEVNITLGKCDEMGIFNDASKIEKEILHIAKLIEGTISAYGTHAAGVIIGDSGKVSRHIPLKNMDSAGLWSCQCNMAEAEEIGLLKMDFLGLKTLDIISKCATLIRKTKGIIVDLDSIPFEKDVFRYIYSTGNTLGVFQVESPGMKNFMKELKPESIEDIIAGIALYRPGPMDFIPKYLQGKNKPDTIKYHCPQLEPILRNTYGCIIYQEQVMQIVRDLAGYTLGRSDLVRRAMSKKKTAVMEKERKNFVYGNPEENIKGCINNGIREDIANKIFDEMIDFAKYAFNKSHAAAYAVVSYQTAYLKFHYPIEFYTAVMSIAAMDNNSKKTKLPPIICEVREKGIKLLAPDINKSEKDFTTDGEVIIYGLSGINGIKNAADKVIEKRGAGYNSFKDYLLRGHEDKSSTLSLIRTGAFDSLCSNRKALELVTDPLVDIKKKLEKKQLDIVEKESKYLVDVSNRKCKTSYELAKNTFITLKNHFMDYKIDTDIYEDKLERLNNEYKCLGGIYVSGHPLDSYDKPEKAVHIADIYKEEYVYVYGIVKSLEIKNRKADGKEMAFFDVEDLTGKMHIACFTKEYEKYSERIKPDAVLLIIGKVNIQVFDSPSEDGEQIIEKQLVLKGCDTLSPIMPTVIMHIPSMIYYSDYIAYDMEKYSTRSGSGDGIKLLIHDRMTGEIREYDYPVSKDITSYTLIDNNISFSDVS